LGVNILTDVGDNAVMAAAGKRSATVNRKGQASSGDQGVERPPEQAAHSGESVLPDLTTRSMLGERLQALRTAKGLTLQDVADATGLSRTFVGMVEQGKSEIAVARLLRIADFYGVTIHDLITTGADPAIEVVPGQVARRVPTGEEGVSLILLATRSDRSSQPFIVELAPQTQLDGLAHSGDEWIVCVEGKVRVRVAEAEHTLRPGDTVFYPGRLTHGYFNDWNDPVRIIGSVVRTGL
jgi:transcriptional regulator with XRE-family HTH domain